MAADAADVELLVRISQGARSASEAERELCRRYGPRIRLYGLRHLRDEERARDLVQMVLLGLLEAARAGRVRAPDQLVRFVLGTCRNATLRMKETSERMKPMPDEALTEAMGGEPPPEPVDASALLRCLDRLPPRSREVVHLSFHEEIPGEVIAERLGLSRGNVRVVRHRALAALRACLEEHREPPG